MFSWPRACSCISMWTKVTTSHSSGRVCLVLSSSAWRGWGPWCHTVRWTGSWCEEHHHSGTQWVKGAMQCILSAGEGLVGRISARFAGTTVTITSFTFFSLGSNLEQTALQYRDLEESQSDAQPCKCIGKTFVQPRDGEQWPLTCHLYFNLSLSSPLSASSEMGPEQPSQLLPCSWTTCSAVAHSARPAEPWVEFYPTASSSTDTRSSRLQ